MDYKPNSHKSKTEEKKVEKVVKGKVKTRKKSEVQKMTDMFIGGDKNSVKNTIITEVIVPSVKKIISDVVTDGISLLLYGETGGGKRTNSGSRPSYTGYYNSGARTHASNVTRTVAGYSYDEIILSSRGEAEEVLSQLDELIDTYGTASVADLYDLVGITGKYTDNNYGWTNLKNADAIRTRDGEYLLKMPKALPLK